jgi:curli biogenesis system outer membrane secretion channel CsgG
MNTYRAIPVQVGLVLLLAACSSTRPPQSSPATLQAAYESIAPAPSEQQPILVVRVDAGAALDGANVQTIVFQIPGVDTSSGSQMAQPDKALAFKTSRGLNQTQRFRVVSFDEMREMKQLKEEGLLAPGGDTDWALKPDYMVTCTIIDMNPGEADSEDGFSIGPFKMGSSESMATVKVAVKVVSLSNGLTVWEGEAKGEQSSKSKRSGLNFGLFSTKSGESSSPTLEAAMDLCVMDMTKKLADRIPLRPIPGATNEPGA